MLQLPGLTITEESPTFVIAEIGINHQGDVNLAKKLIEAAKESGADCVKFQKSCLEEKFNKGALLRPYNTPNSFGTTYAEHKKHLELSDADFLELQKHAKKIGIFFTASAMDVKSVDFLASIDVPFIKIGSGDANNVILIKAAASKNLPLVISTGMHDFETIQEMIDTVKSYHSNFAVLHCVSSYPTPVEDVNLNVIKFYKEKFPGFIIGYSGHEFGIHISEAAVALGAKIIERHLTLDKTMKGSDHCCSLEPQDLKMLIRHIRDIEKALGEPSKKVQKSELVCYQKLGKSIVSERYLKAGTVLREGDLKIKVAEPKGIDGKFYKDLIGKTLLRDVNGDESITNDFVSVKKC